MRSSLAPLLARLEAPSVLVLSDRYPPRSYGGAEVSLHIVLRRVARQLEVLVVTFDDHATAPALYEHERVQVLQLPRQGLWPHHDRARAAVLRPAASGAYGRLQGWFGPRSQRPGDANAELLFEVAAAGPSGGVVADPVEYSRGLGAVLLAEIFRTLRPSLVHADNHRSIALASEAARGLSLKLVGLVRDNRFHCVRHDQSRRVAGKMCSTCDYACADVDLPGAPELQRGMLQRAAEYRAASLSAMDRVIVTSRYLEDSLKHLVAPEKLLRIENPVDDIEDADRSMLGAAELPGTNVLVVGMLNENKGQFELVSRLELLVSKVPDIVLHFAGRGERMTRRLVSLADGMGLAERLRFHGHLNRDGLYRLYRNCQIVALPTLWPEPFGRVPLEAGCASRAVVAFAVGGLKESVLHGETGLLVQPGDSLGFVEAVTKLAHDAALRRRLGRSARQHVLSTYDVESVKDRYLRTWNSLRGAA